MFTPSPEGESKERMALNASDVRSSPIQRLSLEILAEIFVHCLEGAGSRNHIGECPLLLCRVCSPWRSLALYTPRLWSTLYICPVQTPCDIDEFAGHIHSWIQRSGSLPLKLKFDSREYEGEDEDDLIYLVLTAYLQYASRWHTIEINFDIVSFELLENLFQNPVYAPLLRTFVFRECLYQAPFPFEVSFHALTRFSSSLVTRSLTDINISWNLLTHLDICVGFSYSTALEALHLCPRLVYYTVILIEHPPQPPVESKHGPLIQHDNLGHFSLTFSCVCRSFFDRLVLPALHHFKLEHQLDYKFGESYSYHEELLALFTRSRCKLTVLELHSPWFSPGMLLWHESCQTLHTISFKSFCNLTFDDETLSRLTRVPGREGDLLCPVLQQLDLEFILRMAPGMLAAMILSRCSPQDSGTTLSKVFIRTQCDTLYTEDRSLLYKVEPKVCYVRLQLFKGYSSDDYDTEDISDL